jgi:hypothetical protein
MNLIEIMSHSPKKKILSILLLSLVFLLAISLWINAPLVNSSSPNGIVSFELARSSEKASFMIASWDANEKAHAAFGLGFDYLFILIYTATFTLACHLAAGRFKGGISRLGNFLAWGVLLAALLDAVENIGLWNSIIGNSNSTWPIISFWCALPKFALLLLSIIYSLVGWLIWKREKVINR